MTRTLTRLSRLTRILLPLAGAGCAYYNGLYNAKQLVQRAERAEREGRTFDAQGYWGQAGVKAETVLARHPHSRWTDEARYVQGVAHERTGDCAGAIAPLQQVVRESRDQRRIDRASLALAACLVTAGDVEAAGLAVERLLNSSDPAVRSEAAWRAGVAYRREGRSAEAVTTLRMSGAPRARGELAAAYADQGTPALAIELADSLVRLRDTAVAWDGIFAAIGARDQAAASALLDRALARLPVPPETQATWLMADADRWLASDTARAFARFDAAAAAAPDRPTGGEAKLAAISRRLAATRDLTILDSLPGLVGDFVANAGAWQLRARNMLMVAEVARGRLDSLATAPQGDLRGFLLGELLRDSLGAPGLASTVWRRVVAEHPRSPYAGKSLLAIAWAGEAPRDSVLAVLAASYPDDPYLHALQGGDDPRYAVLEDSLARFARTQVLRGRSARPPARTTRPGQPAPKPQAEPVLQ